MKFPTMKMVVSYQKLGDIPFSRLLVFAEVFHIIARRGGKTADRSNLRILGSVICFEKMLGRRVSTKYSLNGDVPSPLIIRKIICSHPAYTNIQIQTNGCTQLTARI